MSDQCVCSDVSNTAILGVILFNVVVSVAKPFIYKLMHNKLVSNLVQYVDKQIEVEIPHVEKKDENKV